jgi:serine/threonine protein kinase/WD40 repeat protein
MTERDLFEAALELPPESRVAYLDGACGSDAAMRQRLQDLLRQNDQAGSFLEEPAANLPSPLWGRGAGGEGLIPMVDEPAVSERPGTVIGPYKLLEQIGEGGFGAVFMAEQQQPIRRKVALKVIKPGMDSRQVIARFEAERQALALMDHPNIAHVFDGGETASGRPYFVMELVKGLPIVEFCDQDRLSVRERLELFITVCQAVQHAHQKGIIHRDLKPSNVMVTLHDGTPVIKIIDFGIAKATGQQLTEKTLFTNFAHLIGTPLYMSPEQAALSGLDVDTRSDIYSLGVLLYELLTGTTPFEKQRFEDVGYDEIRRIIREEEPPNPSTRISTLGQAATTFSTQRKSDPDGLSHLFRGELDWIVMKCLDKDRNRRYETVSALARDIGRYLHDEPVRACPPSVAYRFRKFARRHRAALATGTLVAGVLVVGSVVSVWLAVRAIEAERLAANRLLTQTEARQAADVERDTARRRLFDARLAQAQAAHWSGRFGQRFDSWKALTEASQIVRELNLGEQVMLQLRNEAIACLALADVRLDKEWPGYPPGSSGAIGFDANLERYARSDEQGNISVRLLADDHELTQLPGRGSHGGGKEIRFSPNGDFLAVSYWRLLPRDPTNFRLWDWKRRAVICRPSFPVNAMAFSPDGRSLVLVQDNGTLVFVEPATGKELRQLSLGSKAGCAAFHPDGAKLALGSSEGTVQVLDVATGDLIRKLDGPPAAVCQVAWHPDGNLLAAGADDWHVHLWNATTGRPHAVLPHQNNGIGVAFSPDGNLLLSWAWDGTACLWDPWAGRQLVRFGSGGGVSHFSANGRRVISQNGTRLGLWEVASSREYRTLSNSVRTRALDYGSLSAPDGRWLAAGGPDGVKLWDLAVGKEQAFLPLGKTGGVVFHPSGRELITSSTAGLDRWPLELGPDCLHLGEPHRVPVPGRVHEISLDQRGRILAVTDRDYRGGWIVNLEEPANGVKHFDHPDAHWVATSPDGRWVASGPFNGYGVKVWETRHGELERLLLPDERIAAVAFSPDGRCLVISTNDEFGFWEVGSWKPVRQISRERADGNTGPMAFSADGKMLALSTARDLVQLVDPATGRTFAKLQAPNSDAVKWMAFCPDGAQLLVGSNTPEQGLVRVWDLRLIRAQLKDLGLDWDL